jgi:hypothetical protein
VRLSLYTTGYNCLQQNCQYSNIYYPKVLIGYRTYFPLKFLHFLAPGSGSGFPIRIRVHKVTESGSNPDPQPCHPSLADSYLYISSFIPDGSNVLTGSVRRCQSSLIQPQITHDTGLVPHPVYALDSKCIKYKFLRTFSLFPAFKPLSYNFF